MGACMIALAELTKRWTVTDIHDPSNNLARFRKKGLAQPVTKWFWRT